MDVFVYGTLTDPDRAAAVLGPDGFTYRGPARLDGLHRVDGDYPTLAPGGRVDGRLLRTDDVASLDRYEGVDRGLYVRVDVPVATGGRSRAGTGDEWSRTGTGDERSRTVAVYVGDPAALDVPDRIGWPGDGPLAERVASYVDEEGVVVRPVDGG